jgi:hypothetical protein
MNRAPSKIPGGYDYILGAWLYAKLAGRGPLLCCYCLKPLKLGDKILSKTRRRKTRRYHKECWDQTFVA